MSSKSRKILSMVLAVAMVLTSYGVVSRYAEAKSAVKLSSKSITISVKGKKTIKVKNSKKKAKWSIKKGSKYISLSKKKKSSVVVAGKKAGSAVVQAKIGSKKLTCKVKVKKAAKKTSNTNETPVTQAPVTQTPVTQTPATQTPGNTNTDPTKEPAATPEAVKDIVIDMSKVATKVFTATGNKLDLHDQFDSRFDLSYFSRLEVSYVATFTDGDSSTLGKGKVGVAEDESSLSGYGDGVAYSFGIVGGKTLATVDLSGVEKGTKVYGLNIQPMTSDFKVVENFKSIEITGVKFIAKPNTFYPLPGAAVEATPTPGPTIVPKAFVYEGLDQEWMDSIPKTKKLVAYTFDDGPVGTADTSTSMIIQKALKAHNAHATFNYIGQEITNKGQAGIDEIKMAQANGFEIGNHSFNYDSLPANEEKIKDFIGKTQAMLTEITGFSNFTFRPPNLSVNKTMQAYIDAPFIDCSIDTVDWNGASVADIVAAGKKAKDGDIVLMHMTQANTAAAIDQMLTDAEANNIQVVSVSELFAMKGKTLTTGQVYKSAN